jgi:hypothetical protein
MTTVSHITRVGSMSATRALPLFNKDLRAHGQRNGTEQTSRRCAWTQSVTAVVRAGPGPKGGSFPTDTVSKEEQENAKVAMFDFTANGRRI